MPISPPTRRLPRPLAALAILLAGAVAPAADAPARPIDFNREIRPILSNHCFQCHGPDARKRKGVTTPLRLDNEEGAFADLGGYAAIVRGNPEESELIQRVISTDPTEAMPPPAHGKKPSAQEVELLTEWVRRGAPYARHWAYVPPTRLPPPEVRVPARAKTAIDRFLLARLDREGLSPAPEADRPALIRRVALDLTGLPPTPEEVDAFASDTGPDAYEKLVDRLLDRPAYGEHWARMWLDLARYADSSGYADDPARTIWAYRDYVIRSFNANKPFDQFTIEQIAGDLLPGPTDEQFVATAFHRNTPTNNEGGTNDEEFRNVAVVDRVNTTMAVWMGTTIACAQCHDHKYDPLSQKEYFQFFAFFNNTGDADRGDDSPILPLESAEQRQQKAAREAEIARLQTALRTPTPELLAGQARWEAGYAAGLPWQPLKPGGLKSQNGAKLAALEDLSVKAEPGGKTDVYTVESRWDGRRLAALRLETLPDDALPGKGPGNAGGNFVVSRVLAAITPPDGVRPAGRYVRVDLPGSPKILSLAEVQVFRGAENVATRGAASQSSTAFDGPAPLAIDGDTDGRYFEAKSTTHTESPGDPWWEVDLKAAGPIDRIVVWNRTDGNLQGRLAGARVTLLDEARKAVWTQAIAEAPQSSAELSPSGVRAVTFASAFADYSQPMFAAAGVIDNKDVANQGWAVGGQPGKPHALTLIPATPIDVPPGSTLTVTIEQRSRHEGHTIGKFRLAASEDERAGEFARTPADVLASLTADPASRTDTQRAELTRHYLAAVAPELKATRERLAALKQLQADTKPATTVPVFRELAGGARRPTRVQRRGNYLDLGEAVTEGVPAAFPPLPAGAPRDRLALAHWLVDGANPLTARVVVNRYWEQVFGAGLVPTSEEFGTQGEPPTHPELLDWLATELVAQGWDLKRFLKLLVTSAAYRQDSRVAPELLRLDPDNLLLARGPRFRLPAETIRDQALAVAGLLSPKLYGPPVKPPQPASGLSAAFGGGIDWQTSPGEDKYRRALYTTWRRSNLYPSMATFDAPSREVCTVRRTRTNTPLQALVTLNDPVYVEAAQALARRIGRGGEPIAAKVRAGVRLCLAREPSDAERDRLVKLYQAAYDQFSADKDRARALATDPLGPAPEGANLAELAAWTVVGNVLLNLDETLMKR